MRHPLYGIFNEKFYGIRKHWEILMTHGNRHKYFSLLCMFILLKENNNNNKTCVVSIGRRACVRICAMLAEIIICHGQSHYTTVTAVVHFLCLHNLLRPLSLPFSNFQFCKLFQIKATSFYPIVCDLLWFRLSFRRTPI